MGLPRATAITKRFHSRASNKKLANVLSRKASVQRPPPVKRFDGSLAFGCEHARAQMRHKIKLHYGLTNLPQTRREDRSTT